MQKIATQIRLVQQAKEMSEEAWVSKCDKLVKQYQHDAADARSMADERLQQLATHQAVAVDYKSRAETKLRELERFNAEQAAQLQESKEQFAHLKTGSDTVIGALQQQKRGRAKKAWNLLSTSVQLGGILRSGVSPTHQPPSDEGYSDEDDAELQMLKQMELNVHELQRTKLELETVAKENSILRNRCGQLELQYGMQGSAINALRLAALASKLREKQAVKRGCAEHLKVKDLQIRIDGLERKARKLQHSSRSRTLLMT